MAPDPEIFRSRFVGSRARRCPKCGGEFFHVNVMGGLVCSACSPGASVLRLEASFGPGGRLVWSEAVNEPQTATATAGGPGAGGGGLAGGGAVVAGLVGVADDWGYTPPKPFSDGQSGRIDPPETSREISISVSTSLGWFVFRGGSGGFYGRDIVFDAPTVHPEPGSYRPLSQPYFAWLVSRVDATNQRRSNPVGLVELREIAEAAVAAGVFGDWASDESNWPRLPPSGYLPPVAYSPGDDWESRFVVNWDGEFDKKMDLLRMFAQG